MKIFLTLALFLEAFLGCSLANKVSDTNDQGTYQSVHISQEDRIANIHNYSGFNGWDAIWDYQKLVQGNPLRYDSIFLVGKTRVQDVAEFGSAIQQLCGTVPTYYASQEQGASLHLLSQGCVNVGILHLFGIYLCGNTWSC